MTATPIMSQILETALREAIRDHADQHHRGQQDLAAILETLGKLAGSYLAEFGPGRSGDDAFIAFGLLIATQMRRQRHIAGTSSALN